MWIKQFYNHKVWGFATAFRVRKILETFEKRAPGRAHYVFLGKTPYSHNGSLHQGVTGEFNAGG